MLEEVDEHHRSLLSLIRASQERHQDRGGSPGERTDAENEEEEEALRRSETAAILVHHQAILRNKRALLAYTCVSVNRSTHSLMLVFMKSCDG